MSEKLSDLNAEVERLRVENDKLRSSNRRWTRIAGMDDLTGRHRRNIPAFECGTCLGKTVGGDRVVEDDKPIS